MPATLNPCYFHVFGITIPTESSIALGGGQARGMWLWVMSQIPVLLWGRCWLTSDSWSTEAVWSEEQSSRNALPCSLPWVMWRQERISPSSSPTHSDVSGDISGTGSSEGPEHAGLGHWSGCTPLPEAGIAKSLSLPWALVRPRSCWSRLQHESSRQLYLAWENQRTLF